MLFADIDSTEGLLAGLIKLNGGLYSSRTHRTERMEQNEWNSRTSVGQRYNFGFCLLCCTLLCLKYAVILAIHVYIQINYNWRWQLYNACTKSAWIACSFTLYPASLIICLPLALQMAGTVITQSKSVASREWPPNFGYQSAQFLDTWGSEQSRPQGSIPFHFEPWSSIPDSQSKHCKNQIVVLANYLAITVAWLSFQC